MKFKFAIPVALAALALGTMVPAAHAVTVKQIRQGDLIAQLSDTRATGHYEFLSEGIHVWTEGNSGTDKVAEYFPVSGSLPATSKMSWLGLNAPGNPQPGVQIVFDVDSTTGNGNDYNILVGEPVYGTDGSGNYTDWWASTGSFVYNKQNPDTAPGPNNLCPLTTGGSGTACHGTLAQWTTKIPTARMYAGGFSLGSGVKNDGVIRSITYGDTEYVFTDTPAAVTKDVTGTVKAKVKKNLVAKLKLKADALPANTTQGKALTWRIVVDGSTVATFDQSAGQISKLSYAFGKDTGTHKVVVFKNDVQAAKLKVRTNLA